MPKQHDAAPKRFHLRHAYTEVVDAEGSRQVLRWTYKEHSDRSEDPQVPAPAQSRTSGLSVYGKVWRWLRSGRA